MEIVTNAWAVIRRNGQIQHIDGGLTKRLAVFKTKADADRDCDKNDEYVVAVEIRVVARQAICGYCGIHILPHDQVKCAICVEVDRIEAQKK